MFASRLAAIIPLLLTPACYSGYSETADTGDSNGGGGDCGSPSATAFRITAVSATAPAQKPDGTDWDIDGSYPDLFCYLGTEADYTQTSTTDNAPSATFTKYWEGVVSVDAFIELYDEDTAAHDFIFGSWLSLNDLQTNAGCGDQTLSDGGASIVYKVESI